MIIAKNLKKSTALLAVISCLTANVLAYDGQVNFIGLVKDDGTCRIEVNSQNQTVQLPTVSANSLSTRGKTAGRTQFTIRLSQCNAEDSGRVQLTFKPTNETDGILNNLTTNGARNVGIQLINATNEQALPLNGNADNQKVVGSGIIQGSQIIQPRFDYYAQYYATGKATAGNVSAVAEFEISYP